MRKPFWITERKCWYVKNDQGKKIRLDPDEETAFQMWERMRQVSDIHDRSSFAALAEAWLQEHEALIEDVKFKQLGSYITRFSSAVKGRMATDITKSDLVNWLRAKKPSRDRFKRDSRGKKVLEGGLPVVESSKPKPWSKTTQADAGHAIKRVYAWAHNEGKITRNPLASLKLAQSDSRKVLITLEQHRKCLAEASPGFRSYLIASRCGARPRQIREVTKEHVYSLPDGRMIWAFSSHKTDKSGKHLVVYLSPCMATLTRILMQSKRKFLFVNEDGNQWKKDTVSMTMRRLRERVGIESVTVYAYRHSFATDALLAGHSLAVVAELLGHSDTRMVGRVYGHLDQQKSHLLDAVSDTQKKRLN